MLLPSPELPKNSELSKNVSSNEKIEKSPEECTTGSTNLPAVIGMLAGVFAAHIAEVFPVWAQPLLWHHCLEALDIFLSRFQLSNNHGQTVFVRVACFRRLDMVAGKGDRAGK